MPNKDTEGSWEAAHDLTWDSRNPTHSMIAQAAAWKYHQYLLHPRENKISFSKLKRMTIETFRHLTPAQIEALKKAHSELPPHNY